MKSIIEVRDDVSSDVAYYIVAYFPDAKTAIKKTDEWIAQHSEPPLSENMVDDDDLRHVQLDYYEVVIGWDCNRSWLGSREWTRDDDGNGEWGPWKEVDSKNKLLKELAK